MINHPISQNTDERLALEGVPCNNNNSQQCTSLPSAQFAGRPWLRWALLVGFVSSRLE